MNSDFRELLQALNEFEVEYLVIGGYAVIRYTQPRYTKDLDLWIGPSTDNAERVIRAFNKFGIGLFGGVEKDDFAHPGLMFSVGVPPVIPLLKVKVTILFDGPGKFHPKLNPSLWRIYH